MTVAGTLHSQDVFTLGVLRSLLESVPSEMAEVLKRTSYHPIFNEVLDFSTACWTKKAGSSPRPWA